jgi:hypothetical protein
MLHIEKDMLRRRGKLMSDLESVAGTAIGRAIQPGLRWIGVILEIFEENTRRQEATVLQKLASRAIRAPCG